MEGLAALLVWGAFFYVCYEFHKRKAPVVFASPSAGASASIEVPETPRNSQLIYDDLRNPHTQAPNVDLNRLRNVVRRRS